LFSYFNRYGFITFENQEDADRIIKKEVNVEVSCIPCSNTNHTFVMAYTFKNSSFRLLKDVPSKTLDILS